MRTLCVSPQQVPSGLKALGASERLVNACESLLTEFDFFLFGKEQLAEMIKMLLAVQVGCSETNTHTYRTFRAFVLSGLLAEDGKEYCAPVHMTHVCVCVCVCVSLPYRVVSPLSRPRPCCASIHSFTTPR